MTKTALLDPAVPDVTLDWPVLAADIIADSGVLEAICQGVGSLAAAIPERVVRWLGPELRTPDNSPAPRFVPAEPGPWNGVLFIEGDQPAYWALVRASAPRAGTPGASGAPPFGQTRPPSSWHDPRERPSYREPAYSTWPHDDEPYDPDRPWEHPPWPPRR